MKRLVIAAAAALVVVTAIAPTGPGAGAQSGEWGLNIVDAATFDYPGAPNPLVLCVNGTGPQDIEVGSVFEVSDRTPGDVQVDVYENTAATCADTPDRSTTVSMAVGDFTALVIGWDDVFTFAYDVSCTEPGDARVLVANGTGGAGLSTVDVYGRSQSTGDAILLASSVEAGTASAYLDLPADTYLVEVFAPGADPNGGPPLAVVGDLELDEATVYEIFLAGGADGDAGGFTGQQETITCATEPPTEVGPTTSTTEAAAPGTAVPATPVRGTAAYTG